MYHHAVPVPDHTRQGLGCATRPNHTVFKLLHATASHCALLDRRPFLHRCVRQPPEAAAEDATAAVVSAPGAVGEMTGGAPEAAAANAAVAAANPGTTDGGGKA